MTLSTFTLDTDDRPFQMIPLFQDGEMLPSQDSVMLPTPRHHELSLDDDVTDPIPTAETSNKVHVFILYNYV